MAALGWTGRRTGNLAASPFKGCLGTREERIWCFHQYLPARRGLSQERRGVAPHPVGGPMTVRPPVCVWLKRDLRVTDHAALATAVERSWGGAVFAVFLYEPEVLGEPEWDSSHTAFQEECLRELEPALARLGIRLITRQGGGERAAHDVLDDFLSRRGRAYSGGISSPATAATACSRLSPRLAFGTLSMRRVWQASGGGHEMPRGKKFTAEQIIGFLCLPQASAERAVLGSDCRGLTNCPWAADLLPSNA